MKDSTWYILFITATILYYLILFVDYFNKIALPQDAIWFYWSFFIFMILREGGNGKQAGKYFSKSFVQTYKYVFIFWVISTWLGGSAEAMDLQFRNGTLAESIGYAIGIIISLLLVPLILTYLIRLVLPFFKKIHDKANK